MEIKIIHKTVDNLDINGPANGVFEAKSMEVLGGREAGICYAAENYFNDKIYNTEAALNRANTVVKSGHHSPFDHGYIGLEISGLPKIMAMLLNSTEFYTTSEKSARYTRMNPNTEFEMEAYTKWHKIFYNKIKDLEYDISDKDADKLALENARYMLSVFTPTAMGYTTSYRQLSYMVDWLNELATNLKSNPNKFNNKLLPYCTELSEKLSQITEGFIHDNKGNRFQFLPQAYGISIKDRENIGNVYEVTYYGSLAMLAQAQRHRTLHYEMEIPAENPGEFGCFIPPIISDDEELREEWINDFAKLADEFPQCTLVKILEQGRAYWFIKKCAERLCGRAQLEIAMRTRDTMQLFYNNLEKLDENLQKDILEYENKGKIVPRCGTTWFKCTEGCRWGKKNGLDRPI